MFGLFVLLFVQLSYADGEKPSQFPGGGAADLLSNTKFDPTKVQTGSNKNTKISLQATCVDDSGKTFSNHEAGYEKCMSTKRTSKNEIEARKTKGSAGIKYRK